MIYTRKDLRRIINLERKLYFEIGLFENYITCDVKCLIYKYVKLLRRIEYHHKKNGIMHKMLYLFIRRKKNKLGIKLGIEMWDGCIDEGLLIYHAGNIVINGNSKIGKNLRLHGSNCIGNNGKDNKCPVIGDNVSLGVGAKVIGDVYIANNVKVAAGAVVCKSCYEEGVTLVGIPARVVNKK